MPPKSKMTAVCNCACNTTGYTSIFIQNKTRTLDTSILRSITSIQKWEHEMDFPFLPRRRTQIKSLIAPLSYARTETLVCAIGAEN